MAGRNQFRKAVTVPNGNPRTFHSAVTGLGGSGFLEPGEVGSVLPWLNEQYQQVTMDSGATAATATGLPAAGQLAFWKDRTQYQVTNNALQAEAQTVGAGNSLGDARNSVAGIIPVAVLPGETFYVVQKSPNISVKSSSTPATGATMVANTGTNADAVSVAAGTAPSSQPLGVAIGPGANTLVPTSVSIEFID